MSVQRRSVEGFTAKDLGRLERTVETRILKNLREKNLHDSVHDAVHDGFGKLVKFDKGKKALGSKVAPTSTNERAVQNGVSEPAPGGVCEAVWKICDKLHVKGKADLKNVVAQAEKQDLNPTNARVELYRWRKFNGIS